MNILHACSNYHPSIGGSQEVIRRVSEGLVRNGHSVTIATSFHPDRHSYRLNGVDIATFRLSGNSVDGLIGNTEEYQRFLLESSFDLMMVYGAHQWPFDAAIPILSRIPYKIVFAPCGFSALSVPAYAGYYAALPDIIRNCDSVLLHSDTYRDAVFMRKHGLDHYTVIPNGADAAEFSGQTVSFRDQYRIPSDMPLLLHVGSHTGLKGHSLLLKAFLEARIGPAVFALIGNTIHDEGCLPRCRQIASYIRLRSLLRKRVLVLDPDRERVVAAFHDADLFLCASRVECSPIVLFESMASRTPFVTIDCGNARELISWGQSGICVSTEHDSEGNASTDPALLARAIEDLIGNPDTRQRLASRGLRAWKSNFTWERIITLYEELYRSIIDPVRYGSPRKEFTLRTTEDHEDEHGS